jgi:hypothetical protein
VIHSHVSPFLYQFLVNLVLSVVVNVTDEPVCVYRGIPPHAQRNWHVKLPAWLAMPSTHLLETPSPRLTDKVTQCPPVDLSCSDNHRPFHLIRMVSACQLVQHFKLRSQRNRYPS